MANNIQFTKMHALGNDFVVIDNTQATLDLQQFPIKILSDRHIGIGFDQLLIIEARQKSEFFCRIFNADGSHAEQCGNGLRCVARYIHEHKLDEGKQFNLATVAGIFPVTIKDYDHIQVNMGKPELKHKIFKLNLPHHQEIELSILSLGNPHAILKVDKLDEKLINDLGKTISTHSLFPEGTNVGFMQVIDNKHIRLSTFERGSGITLACGSNACAAAFAGIANGWLTEAVSIEYQYGNLEIEVKDNTIFMTGPATQVFSGRL